MRGTSFILGGLIAAVVLLATGVMRLGERVTVVKGGEKRVLVYGMMEGTGRVVERGAQLLNRPMVEEKEAGWGWTVEGVKKVKQVERVERGVGEIWVGEMGTMNCENRKGGGLVSGKMGGVDLGIWVVVVGRMAGEESGDGAFHGAESRV